MLDENLPTYRFRPSPDSPTDSLLHYTHSGSDPTPAFLVRRPPPSTSQGRYAAALSDPSLPSIIYAETLVTPTFPSPPLPSSSAHHQVTTAAPPREPVAPETLTLTLYNPDQAVTLKHSPSGWNRSEAWDFEIPERTFRMPSSSRLDRDETSPAQDAKVPKVAFRWKKDGRMSRDMTCYMVGRSVDGRRSKEPDITVALFSQGKADCALTIYEPNMRRVEIEDRKGLEVVLLLGAEAIRALYLAKGDPYNLAAGGGSGGKRRESRPAAIPGPPSTTAPPTMAGAVQAPTPQQPPLATKDNSNNKDRERRDREEQDRIRRMLEKEEARERARRNAEVDAETERLRKLYGVPPGADGPPLPPRPANSPTLAAPTMPPRPVSAGPYSHGARFEPGMGPAGAGGGGPAQGHGHGHGHGHGKKKVENLVSGLFRGEREREEEKRKKVQKKRSVHF